MHDLKNPRRFVQRVRTVFAIFAVGLVLVGLRAMQLQIDQHEHLSQLAQEQYLNTVKIPARRGHIYDRNGTPLAVSVDVPSVFANPAMVEDAASAARRLAPILQLPKQALHERLASERYFVWLKRQVTPDVAESVRALKIKGISITKEPRRFYPNREVGAQLIGFTGRDGQGLEGIEKALDTALVGHPQMVAAMRDARGRAVLGGGLDPLQRARGQDVYLTLDLPIQHLTEQALARVMQSTHAKSASAVVLDVASAEVLAMAVVPTYNPNRAAQASPGARRNRVLTDIYEPGSVIKPLVVGSALDSRALSPNAQIFCENGKFKIGRHTINDTSPHGLMSLTEIIAKSSNIGMAKIAQTMGKNELERSLRSFGFGQRTNIGFPGEVQGVLRPSSSWSELETATIAFGQAMAVNGLQMAAAYRVLAADGAYKKPQLVRAMEGANQRLQPMHTSSERPVLTWETAQQVTRMLEAASGPTGSTGRLASVPGYRVAGKTGTAQKADPLTGGYSRDRYIALFVGFLPVDAPRVVISVAVDEPMTNHYGGVVAAPVFAEIGAAVMQRLGVIATEAIDEKPLPVAAQQPSKDSSPPTQNPVVTANAQPLAPKMVPVTLHQPANGLTPSFLGLTSRQAIERYTQAHVLGDLNLQGTGTVIRQEPPAGTPIRIGQSTRLVLAP